MRADWTGRTRALWELWTQRSGMNRSPMVLRWLEPLSTNRVSTEESYEKLKCMIVKWAMKSLELGILTRWYDLPPRVKPAVEIIKFKEMREFGFQSGLIFMSRCWEHETTKLCTNHQADHMSSIL